MGFWPQTKITPFALLGSEVFKCRLRSVGYSAFRKPFVGLSPHNHMASSLISLYFYLCLSIPTIYMIHTCVCYITLLLLIYSPSNHLSINHPPICTSNIHPSIQLPIHLPIHPPSICTYIHVYLHKYTHPSIHPTGCVLPNAKPG